MAYQFHITRVTEGRVSKKKAMRLEEWQAAVAAIDGIRLETDEL